MPNDNTFKVVDLHKSFKSLDVLKGIDFEFKKGLVYSIIGPSGSGKSTLLRCLNMLELPTGGQVFFKNQLLFGLNKKHKPSLLISEHELDKYRTKIGMVFNHLTSSLICLFWIIFHSHLHIY